MVAVFYLLFQILVFFIADLAYNRGRAYADAGYVEEAMEPLMRAVNLVPGEPVFRAELGEVEAALAATLDVQRPGLAAADQALSETITPRSFFLFSFLFVFIVIFMHVVYFCARAIRLKF